MIFKRLTNSEDKIYEKAMELYSKSFPIYEQRLPEMRGRGYGAQALSFSASAKRRSFSKSTRLRTKYPPAVSQRIQRSQARCHDLPGGDKRE